MILQISLGMHQVEVEVDSIDSISTILGIFDVTVFVNGKEVLNAPGTAHNLSIEVQEK